MFESIMEGFSTVLAEATEAIASKFFYLPIDGGDPIYRERVYSYELYHQLRKRWRDDSPWTLNGEVDKRAHPILSKTMTKGWCPDLLVHQPGLMKGNHAVIEIKHSDASDGDLQADLTKLEEFIQLAGYQRALLLVYGHDAEEKVKQVIASSNIGVEGIEFWAHEAPGQRAHRLR